MTTVRYTEPAELTRYYHFHGVGIAINASQSGLLETMHLRFKHFAVDRLPSPPDLTFIFQVARAEQSPIEKPKGSGRRINGLSQGDIVYYDSQDLLYIDWGDGFKALCQADAGLARIVMPPESAKLLLATHFLFSLCLTELLKRRGLQTIHAAGLCYGGQGLLFPGTTGAGKSTLTVALLRAGFGLLGDDRLFLTQGEEGMRALAFPDEINVTEQTAGFFSGLPVFSDARKNLKNKAQIAPELVYQSSWVESCIPRLLLFPRVANTPASVLKPINPEEALMELAVNIVFTETRSSQAHLDALGGLIRQCDCYRLETGRDFDTLPGRLQEMLNTKMEKIL